MVRWGWANRPEASLRYDLRPMPAAVHLHVLTFTALRGSSSIGWHAPRLDTPLLLPRSCRAKAQGRPRTTHLDLPSTLRPIAPAFQPRSPTRCSTQQRTPRPRQSCPEGSGCCDIAIRTIERVRDSTPLLRAQRSGLACSKPGE